MKDAVQESWEKVLVKNNKVNRGGELTKKKEKRQRKKTEMKTKDSGRETKSNSERGNYGGWMGEVGMEEEKKKDWE